MSLGNIENSLERLKGSVTPFLAQKTAEQTLDFDIDPSKGLTKKRYKWYSDNVLHDDSYFTDIPGAIEISTSGTGATRVVTAVHDGSTADVTPIKVDVEEGF